MIDFVGLSAATGVILRIGVLLDATPRAVCASNIRMSTEKSIKMRISN